MNVTRVVSTLLQRWREQPANPATAGAVPTDPDAIVLVRIKRKLALSGGPVYNTGEVVGFSRTFVARLVAEGFARRVKAGAIPTVRPRVDPEPDRDTSLDCEMADTLAKHGVWFPPGTVGDYVDDTPRVL